MRGGTAGEVDPSEPIHQPGGRFRLCVLRWGLAEEGTAPCERASACAIGEQAEVPSAHEATRDHVQEKSASSVRTFTRSWSA